MKRDELHKNVREKFLFIGKIATGKSLIALIVTKLYAMNGLKVIYIDPEDGTQREIERGIFDDLTDEQLNNIEIVHANDLDTYLKYVNGWTEEKVFGSQVIKIEHGKDCDLKICDGLIAEMDMCKFQLTQKFIAQKFYTIGDKQFPIKNPDLFMFPYALYGKLYDQLRDIISAMIIHKYDIICTSHPFKETDAQQMLEQSIYGKFDSVIEFNKKLKSNGHPKWDGVVEKNRGREFPDKSNNIESAKPIIAYFIKKFGMPVEETLEKLKFKVEEEIVFNPEQIPQT